MGLIYALRDARYNFKIGFTGNKQLLKARLATFRTGHAGAIELIVCTRGSAFQEKEIHRFLATKRIRGEWFADSPLVRNSIHIMAHYGVSFLLVHAPENVAQFMGIGQGFPRLSGLSSRRGQKRRTA